MKIYSTEAMQKAVQATLRERGVSMRQFIDEISSRMADEIRRHILRNDQPIVIVAGPELNGAYALGVARHLVGKGVRPMTYLFNIGGNRATAECLAMRETFLAECEGELLVDMNSIRFEMPELPRGSIVVDGLFGSERTTPLTGGYLSIIRYINELHGARVFSLDVPSGMLVDSLDGLINRNIVHATTTLTIGDPGIAFYLKDNEELVGQWKRIDPGLGRDALRDVESKFTLVDKSVVKRILRPRSAFASKADCGDAIIYAGSYGMLGAAVLAAKGALRGGAGKVTVHAPRCGFFVLQNSVPCALFDVDAGDVAISQIELKKNYDAVAIGPGIGTADVTIDALDSFLKVADSNSRPVVLDADALNCLHYRNSMLEHIPPLSILTPHEGEFDRLFGSQPSSYARLMKAIVEAERYKVFIILKGRYSAIIWPDGKVYFNPTGTPALATGGTGDVLTGVIAAFLAQGIPPEQTAIAATYVHGLAGELAAKDHGVYGTTATDVAEQIGRAIKSIMN